MTKAYTFFVLLCIYGMAFSQTTVRGVVTEKGSAATKPLAYVGVAIPGTKIGTNTDDNGAYEIKVPKGYSVLEFSNIGYTSLREQIDTSKPSIKLDVELAEEATQLNTVEVSTRSNKDSHTALMQDRSESIVMVQSIGAKQLSSLGISNVGEGMLKITGVSKNTGSSSGSIFVRGLGDRYNNVTLNGFAIPSTDSDSKTPPLEIFPTDIISSLTVSKTYSPSFAGDFSGANIDILGNRASSSKGKLTLGVSSGGNSQSFLKPMTTYQGGSLDYIGYDNTRGMPTGATAWPRDWSTLNNSFSTRTMNGLPQLGLDLEYSQRFKLGEVDISAKLYSSFSNNYKLENYKSRAFQTSGAFLATFDGIKYAYATQFSNFAQILVDFKDSGTLTYNGLYINTSKDETRRYNGFKNDGTRDDLPLSNAFQEYRQNMLFNNQLIYNLKVADRQSIDIGAAYTPTTNTMPDRRSIMANSDPDGVKNSGIPINYYRLDVFGGNPGLTRYFSDMTDNDLAAYANYSYKLFRDTGNKSALKAGYLFHGKDRVQNFSTIQADRTYINEKVINQTPTLQYTNSGDFYSHLNDMFAGIDINKTGAKDSAASLTKLQNFTLATHGVFLNLDYILGKHWAFTVGARYETVDLQTDYAVNRALTYGGIQTQNLLPSFSAKYLFGNRPQSLKFAASKTYSLPQFRELSSIPYNTEIGEVVGNAKLKQADTYNLDLGWEWFPSKGDLISVTGFYKHIKNPIENLFINQSGGITSSVVNSDYANVYGVEAECEMSLSNFISVDFLQPLRLSLNASLLHAYAVSPSSLVHQGLGASVIVYEKKHQLQGATPILLNADLMYRLDRINSQASISYNYAGDTVDQVGAWNGNSVLGAINTLNLRWSTEFKNALKLSITAKNLLNPTYSYTQIIKDTQQSQITNSYTRGVNVGVSLIYDLIR